MLKEILLSLCIASPMAMQAQNPVIRNQFTADPTARVFNGRVYMYPSHDIPAPEDYARKDWFCMADYHVFSSTDLVEWTDHGVIVDQKSVPWGNPTAYSMWAPDCVEKDGKYYFFFPDAPKPQEGQRGGGFGIGVAVADRPEGPFTVLEKNIEGINGIDPCVLLASDGNAYIYWGGGGLRGAKLKQNLTELAEDTPCEVRKMGDHEMRLMGKSVDEGLPTGFKEGPFVFERNGFYYLTYPWVEDKTETLAYAMSRNPLGPFEFKGKIMEQSPTGCWTNHHSIVEYKGQWYLFYHHNDYSPNFDKLRSARIDSLSFNADGTIKPVTPTQRGVGICNAMKRIEIDRYSTISEGVKLAFANPDSLCRFEGWELTYGRKGAYSTYNKVEFPKVGAKTLVARVMAPQSGAFSVCDGKGTVIAKVTVPASSEFITVSVPVKVSPKGITDLKIINTSTKEVAIDWLQFENKILLDTHFNHEVDRRTGKPQHYTWDDTSKWGGYSQFGELFERHGGTLAMLNEAPTPETLKEARAYIIVDPDHEKDNPNPNYMDAESAKTIAQWVKKGGSLLVLTNDRENCDLQHINTLMNKFGLHFNDTTILQLDIPTKEKPENVYPLQGTLPGVEKMYMRGTSSIRCSGKAQRVVWTKDDDTIIAEAAYGKGRVIAIADPWVYNEYIYHTLLPENYDNASAAEHIIERLLGE